MPSAVACGYAEEMESYPSPRELEALAARFGVSSGRALEDLVARRRAGAGDRELLHLLSQPDWGGLSHDQAVELVAQLPPRP